jgi:hypothetical protein
MINEKLIEKIQKLLSLAQSSNEHEARLAAEKANELLIRHNINMSQLAFTDDDFTENEFRSYRRAGMEDKYVRWIISGYFFVDLITSRKFIKNAKGRVEKHIVLSMLGEKNNCSIASYTYNFLKLKFNDLWAEYKKDYDASIRSKQSYFHGLYTGLDEQLSKQKEKIMKETENNSNALVVVDAALQDFVKEKYPNLRYTNTYYNLRDSLAISDGIEHGKNIRINRGIEGKGENGMYLK